MSTAEEEAGAGTPAASTAGWTIALVGTVGGSGCLGTLAHRTSWWLASAEVVEIRSDARHGVAV
jgi:hypothetical protein